MNMSICYPKSKIEVNDKSEIWRSSFISSFLPWQHRQPLSGQDKMKSKHFSSASKSAQEQLAKITRQSFAIQI